MKPKEIKFNEKEQEEAFKEWGANCGPNALAVATGVHLSDAGRVLRLSGFDLKRYTNPTMMEDGLYLLHATWHRERGMKVNFGPNHGLARVQWEGRWLDPGVPKVVAYRHTHWIACHLDHVFCTASGYFGWIPIADYRTYMAEKFCPQNAYRGWHITHHYHLEEKP